MSSTEASGRPDGSTQAAPAVVAVVVTCNAGSWFKQTLEGLRDQDYPNLSVLIIDAASTEDPLERIVETLPSAYVRRLSRNPGYSAAANRVLRILQGATYLVMCHDDIAMDSDAVRKMVEEAMRTNAGLVTPKMVEWLHPDHLLALGGGVDGSGAFVPSIESGDLDQGQHDAPSEVFVAPGACMLVRTDLFTSLGGYDPAMTLEGEDVDFSWRAQAVGARISTAASARVRHLGAATNGLRWAATPQESDDDGPTSAAVDQLMLSRRHRLRTVLKVHRRWWLLVAVVRVAFLSLAEMIYGVISGRTERTSSVVAAWTWNIAHWRDLRKLRRQLQKYRSVDDKTLRRRMTSTRKRLEDLVVHEYGAWRARRAAERAANHGRELVGGFRNIAIAAWATVVVIVLLGSRNLLTGSFPAVGQFAAQLQGPYSSLREYLAVMPTSTWGDASLQSPAHLVLGVLGVVTLGATGTLERLLILGMLPLGLWGMARLAKRLKNRRAALMAVVAYAATPLPYDALATGQWDGLVAYAAMPFVFLWLLRSGAIKPFSDRRYFQPLQRRTRSLDDEDSEVLVLAESETGEASSVSRMRAAAALLAEKRATPTGTASGTTTDETASTDQLSYWFYKHILPLSLVVALAALFAPQMIAAVVMLGIAVAAGSLTSRTALPEATRIVFLALSAAVVAGVLIIPALAASSEGWSSIWSTVPTGVHQDDLSALLRTYAGNAEVSLLTFGLLLAALPALLFGNEWRFNLSLRLWIVTVLSVLFTWAGSHGWLGGLRPDAHVMLAIAAVSVALNAALGVVAVHDDLAGRRVEWRRGVPLVAVVGVVLAIFPIASRAGSGSWDLPTISTSDYVAQISGRDLDSGSFRTLWLGSGDGLPAARRVSSDLAMALTVDNSRGESLPVPSVGGPGQNALVSDLARLRNGDTVQVGHLLAPYGIRYIVIPNRTGTIGSDGVGVQWPPDLRSALSSQLDLQLVDTDDSVIAYRNEAFLPVRSQLSEAAVLAAHSGNAAGSLSSLSNSASPTLTEGSGREYSGGVSPGEVYVGNEGGDAWRLSVDGHDQQRKSGFGWASTFSVGDGGGAALSFHAPVFYVLLQLLFAALWIFVFWQAVKNRVRRGRWA